MKRVVIAAALAMGVLFGSPASAGAWCTFCDWDPLVLIVTPGGHIVPVYDSVWTSAPLDIGLPVENYTTERVYDAQGNPETLVKMQIYLPTGLLFSFQTMDEVTTGLLGSGTLLARGFGTSGSAVNLHFVLHES